MKNGTMIVVLASVSFVLGTVGGCGVVRQAGAGLGIDQFRQEQALVDAAEARFAFMKPYRAAWNKAEEASAKAEGRKPVLLEEYWLPDSNGVLTSAISGAQKSTSTTMKEWAALAPNRPVAGSADRTNWEMAMGLSYESFARIPTDLGRMIDFLNSGDAALASTTTPEGREQVRQELARVRGLVEQKAGVAAKFADDTVGVVATLNPLDTTNAVASKPAAASGGAELSKADVRKGVNVGGSVANGDLMGAAGKALR